MARFRVGMLYYLIFEPEYVIQKSIGGDSPTGAGMRLRNRQKRTQNGLKTVDI